MYLTLCFYEFPAAKAHLDFWEEAMKSRIIEKLSYNVNEKLCIEYYVKRDDTQELVFCIPMELSSDVSEFKHIVKNSEIEFIYLKTLVFGKVQSTDFENINNFVDSIKLDCVQDPSARKQVGLE
jgi:excinuclease UvrABC nuclease subunit